MDLHPWPKKRRSKDAEEDEPEVIPPILPEPKGWYQDLLEHSQDLCCIHDLEGRILSVNAAAARVLEYSVEEMLRLSLREVIAPEFRAEVNTYLKQIESAGTAHGWMTVITHAGERRIWEYHCALRTEGGRLPMVRCIGHDVTEQKQIEKRLREVSESLLDKVREGERTIRDLRLFRTLVDQGNDAIEVVDPDTLRFLDVNEKACSELGYSREELMSMSVFDINPVVTEASAAKVQEELRRSGSLVMESVHRRKDGITFPVELSMKRVQLDRVYVIAISRDLTERKLAEARLRASQDRYRAVQDRSPVGICWVETPTGRFIGVNSKYCEIAGLTEQDLLSRTFQSITHPDDLEENCAKLRELAAGKVRHYEMEKRYVRPDGSIRWVEVAIVAMGEEGEIPTWHMAIVQDISERKQAEDRLREYKRVVEGLDDMIVVVDRDYRYVIANRAYLIYRGIETVQVVGHRVDEFVKKEVFEAILKPRMDECFQGKVVQYEKKYEYPGVGERDLLVSYFPIEGPTGIDRIACVLQDVTERKRTEEALEKSEEKFSKAFQLSPMSITLTTLAEGRYIEVNGAFEHMTGWRHEEVLGRTPLELGLWVNPAERVELGKRLLAEGSIRDVEARLRRKDGAVLIGLGTSEAIEINGELCVISVFADITERKRAEERLREYERVVEGLEENIAVVDRNYVHLLANRAFLKDRGLRREQVIGQSVRAVVNNDQIFDNVLKPRLDECLQGKVVRFELRKSYPALGERDVFASYFPIEGPSGVDRIAVVLLDITERKQAEEALRQSEQRFRVALEGSPTTVFSQDRDLRYTWVYNPQEGMSEEDILGKTDEELFGPEIADRMTAVKRQVLETGKGLRRESSMIVRGKTKYCDLTYEPLRNAAGSVVGLTCACVSVTHLREITEELRLAKEKLSEEKLYLEQAIDSELGFGEIIGRSSALKEVMEKVSKVAPSNATVLLQGETGTGKELVARALHRLSKRNTKTFIKVNCAAIPSGLLESELFGHEKGAFTGAVSRKIGRLELSDQGTLFLDEVGEIPLSLQPKLLRVLQDQEFERLGSTQTIKVNFRLLAATNRNLLQSVKDGDFRSDLFYRLNVFPIVIPPLRDRREDVQVLVEHFVRHYASRMNKSITSIPSKTMESLVQWEWPGNIRELENFVERSVILTSGSVLQAPLGELRGSGESDTGTLRDREREKIIHILRECHGQLGGPNGAAARLGLKRTTLQSRLSQLRIKPDQFRK